MARGRRGGGERFRRPLLTSVGYGWPGLTSRFQHPDIDMCVFPSPRPSSGPAQQLSTFPFHSHSQQRKLASHAFTCLPAVGCNQTAYVDPLIKLIRTECTSILYILLLLATQPSPRYCLFMQIHATPSLALLSPAPSTPPRGLGTEPGRELGDAMTTISIESTCFYYASHVCTVQ